MTTTSVTSGQTDSGSTLGPGDELDIYNGGVAVSANVGTDSSDVIFDGGVALQTQVGLFGTEVVSSGGIASGSTIGYAGAQDVFSGGNSVDTEVDAAGSVYVEDGGIESFGTYTNSGQVFLRTGAVSGGASYGDSIGDAGMEFVYTGGVATAATVTGGGTLILSGGVSDDDTIEGGTVSVMSGGLATSAAVTAGGSLDVFASGNAIYTSVSAGGFETVSSGGFTNSATIGAGGVQTVFAGGIAGFASIDGGNQYVSAGGIAVSATIGDGGLQTVSSAGQDQFGTVANGGSQLISDGGSVISGTVQAGGITVIADGGNASQESVSGGTLLVAAGGTLSSTTVMSGGLIDVLGVTSATTISGGGIEQIEAGGETFGTIVKQHGTQLVLGGTASGTHLTALDAHLTVSGGVAIDTDAGLIGVVTVADGGVARGTVLSGGLFIAGEQTVAAGGVAIGTVAYNGAEDVFGESDHATISGDFAGQGVQRVEAGGDTIATIVQAHGLQHVLAAGIATGTTISGSVVTGDDTGGGEQIVDAGGFAVDAQVGSAGIESVFGDATRSLADQGTIFVHDGGQSFDATIRNGGTETVDAGGFASGTTVTVSGLLTVHGASSAGLVISGGEEDVSTGGVATGTQVQWAQLVEAGGLAVSAVVGSGGVQSVTSGGTATGSVVGSGTQLVILGGVSSDTILDDAGYEDVTSGSTAYSTTVNSGGLLTFLSGGIAAGGTVGFSGMVVASSGAIGGLVQVNAGGTLQILAGASFAFDSIADGGTEIVSGDGYRTEVDGGLQTLTGIGATTTGTVLDDGGDETVQAGAVATGSVVNAGGSVIDEYAGGTGSGSVISAGGNDVVHDAGLAVNAVLAGGRQEVLQGGTASGTVIESGGHQFVESGGTAANTTVGDGGTQVISAGGIADGTVIEAGGTELVSSGGILVGATEIANGGTILVSGGALFEGADATVTLDDGAEIVVAASDTLVLDNIPLTNAGTIALNSDIFIGPATLLVAGVVSLSGGGDVTLQDVSGHGEPGTIEGNGAASVLDNIDNTISGEGELGLLSFTNEAAGVVTAGGLIVLQTGSLVVNHGLLQAVTGVLEIEDSVANTGTIAAIGGRVQLGGDGYAAVIQGGTLASTAGGSVAIDASATLDGSAGRLTLSADLEVAPQATLTLTGAIGNRGTIVLNSNIFTGIADLRILGATTLSGGGTITLQDVSGHGFPGLIEGAGATPVLDNVDNTIAGYGAVGAGQLGLTNEAAGVIDATGGTLAVDTQGATVVNMGVFEAVGGALVLAGRVANTGLIEAGAQGTVTLQGDDSNAGVVGALDGGTLVLDGGGLSGSGTVGTSRLGVLSVVSTGSIDGSTQAVLLYGNTGIAARATLTLAGAIGNAGTIALNSNIFTGAATLLLEGGVTLSGGGEVLMQDVSGHAYPGTIEGTGATAFLDNIDNTIAGQGVLGRGQLSFTNEAAGVVTASGLLVLQTGSLVLNKGLLQASGGVLEIEDAIASTGTIAADGGTVQLGGDGHAATIRGGVLTSAHGGSVVIDPGDAATLDGTAGRLTLSADMEVAPLATLTLAGAIANIGTIALQSNLFTGAAALRILGGVTLSGGGTVTMQDVSGHGYPGTIEGAGAGSSLDNVDDRIVGDADLDVSQMAFTNEVDGVVTTGGLLVLQAGGTVVNKGLLQATAGTLEIEDVVANSGTIAAAGGRVQLGGDGEIGIIRGGTLFSAAGGSVVVDGDDATLDGTAGTLVLFADVEVAAQATLTLAGSIANIGPITLNTNLFAGVAALRILGGVTLSGGGVITMQDISGHGVAGTIVGASTAATLDNIDDTIQGYGALGAGGLGFTNEAAGVVYATDATLTIDTGAAAIVNRGLFQAVGGTLVLAGALTNSGTVGVGAGGSVIFDGAVGGTGVISIEGAGLEIGTAIGGGQTILFEGPGVQTLELADLSTMQASLSGFSAADTLVLDNLAAGVSYQAGASPGAGSLVLSSGDTVLGTIAIAGNYAGDTFLAAPNAASGTDIQVVQATLSSPAPGALSVTTQPGADVSLDEILADPATTSGGPITTLVISGGGTVVAAGNVSIADISVAAGTLRLDGNTIATDPISVAAGSGIAGFGAITGGVTDDGTITAQGGTLELTDAIAGSGVLAIAAGATLQLDASIGSGISVAFQPGGTLQIGLPTVSGVSIQNDQADITAFDASARIVVLTNAAADFVLNGSQVSVVDIATDAQEGVLDFASPALASLAAATPGALVDEIACFASGTLIRTAQGEAAVEALRIGDLLLTNSGILRPIRWIGRRVVNVATHPEPCSVRPVRVAAHAFGADLPARDLVLSPEHAVFLDGVLIPIGALVNGRSIVETPCDTVTYWHVELDSHDVILAEGMPVESFLDNGSRPIFEPRGGACPAPRGTTPCAPLQRQGEALERIRRRIDQGGVWRLSA